MKKDIRTISSTELEEFLLKNNQKSFVAKQVMEWLWKKSKTSFEEMKNISKSNRELLDSNYIINSIDSEEIQVSSDKTIKTKFKLFDGYTVEGVLIPQNKRMTACISSQGHDLRYSINSKKINSLGWNPKNNFDESLKKTIKWYISNSKWLD